MKQLIVGCGYLGRRVAQRWLDRGDEVIALTRSEENAAHFQTLGIEPIIGDVMDAASLTALPTVDTLLYAVGYDRSTGMSQRQIYVDGLRNVLHRMTTRAGRAVYISSTSVYGQTNGEWIDETSETTPTRAGGVACLEAENVFRDQFGRSGATACVLRLAGIYGPGRLLRRVESLKSREPIGGNPDAYLNLIHVDDAARAVLACEEFGLPGETYLVCDDRPIRRREYFERLATLAGAPAPIFGAVAPGSEKIDLNKRCSNRKMHEELRLMLQYPDIEAGLPQAVGANGMQ
jgi:nucleoside-diphosphate-sugar epimerase